MSNFNDIQEKLQKFISKYYVNELIKGLLMFFSIGLLYLIFTLLIEHFLWLKPTARTILFILFIGIELALVIFYIFIPLFKIWGFKKGITDIEASKIIGNHFLEVSDKLLNMLQLQNTQQCSELIEASIEQKSKELKPIPFKRAIDFSSNKKYVNYALIPIVIWLLVLITGNVNIFNDSFSRVVHYQKQYEPPAPFSFKILNESFSVIEGQPFYLKIETVGNVYPEDVKIFFGNQNYYLDNIGVGMFQFSFTSIHEKIDFYVEANGVFSKDYRIEVIAAPLINNLKMVLNYPTYTGKVNEVIQNTGNAIVPQGTTISWQVETYQTNSLHINFERDSIFNFNKNTENYFSFSKQLFSSTSYKISTSNKQLKKYENLDFAVDVVVDEYPKIIVKSNIDSVSRGPVAFLGQLSDDYGVRKLQLRYYDKTDLEDEKTLEIEVLNSSFTDFYYVFPEGILMEDGVDYEFYFEVFDNDAVNGSKRTKSRQYSYYKKTEKELKEELLKEQKETLSTISKSLEKSKNSNSELEKFKNELQKKAEINWNDTKKLDQFMKRQQRYEEMFEKQTNQLEKNLNEQPVSEDLKEKKEELQKRIEEIKKIDEQKKLLDEINKLMEKLEKEDVIDKLKDISKKNKQKEQSLERLLELTKRFYVEQKANQIADKLKKLAEEEDNLSKEDEEENTVEKQEEINRKFDNIEKDFNELDKENKSLKRPMKLPNNEDEKQEINEELEKAMEELKKNEPKNARKSQKSAAKKMKQMSKSMEQSMVSMESEMIDENIDNLRKIVENLIEFSFQQEELMDKFSSADNNHAEYPKNLKQQQVLKEYFEHIDDSLYMLSLRLIKMGVGIRKEVSEVHYNVDKSLINFSENRFEEGISNQHFVITSANNLANQLSDLLESLMNASASMGKGKGNGGPPDFALPDIIKKQGELTEKMKDGMKKGEGPGDKSGEKEGSEKGEEGQGDSEKLNGELYEIYKEQAQLREALKELLGEQKGDGKNGNGDAIKKMEELEKELLENGFSEEVIEKMQQLNYELLQLEKATLEQGLEKKRTSETNFESFEKRNIDKLKLKNQYFNYNEILNRQSLPLRTIYKMKVQEYFKTQTKNDTI